MAQKLKVDTAIKVRMGPFNDVTDDATPETGITLGAADEAELLKANGAAVVSIASHTFAAISGCDGWYDLSLVAGDTDTLGTLDIVIQDVSVCRPVFARFQVVSALEFAIDTQTMTEAYAADATAATIPEMLYMIWSKLRGGLVSGTTQTNYKLDGTTTAMTHTLDDPRSPTTATRTT